MRWPVALLIGMALAAFTSGCHSCDRVESELRARETELREIKEELEHTLACNKALELEIAAQHGVLPVPGASDKSVPIYPVRSLSLGRQTGGVEDSHGSGDQALQVIVEPRDADNQAIKVPGTLLVQVLEVSPEGTKRPLSTWEIGPDQLSRSWRNGLLSTGYALTLPWKVWPSTERLRVVAQFRLQDGRVFEADKDVTIRLPPPHRRMPPPEPVSVPPAEEPLPPPRPQEGPKIDPAARRGHFNEIQRETIPISAWNSDWRPAAQSGPPARLERPIALEER